MTLNAPTIFACVLVVTVEGNRHYGMSPHCRTVSQTVFPPFFVSNRIGVEYGYTVKFSDLCEITALLHRQTFH